MRRQFEVPDVFRNEAGVTDVSERMTDKSPVAVTQRKGTASGLPDGGAVGESRGCDVKETRRQACQLKRWAVRRESRLGGRVYICATRRRPGQQPNARNGKLTLTVLVDGGRHYAPRTTRTGARQSDEAKLLAMLSRPLSRAPEPGPGPPVKGSSSPATGQWWCVPASRTVPAQRIGTPALSEKTISNLVISDLGSMMEEGSCPRPDLSSAGPCRRACLRREMDHGGIGANNEAAECLAGWHSTAHGQGERGTSCCTAGPIGIMPGFKSQRSELERAKR